MGLFASFTMAVVISIVGGRRAMISAATGAIALVIAPLNCEHGLGYLIAAVVLAETKYAQRGKRGTIIGLNKPSTDMHERLAGQLATAATERTGRPPCGTPQNDGAGGLSPRGPCASAWSWPGKCRSGCAVRWRRAADLVLQL